MSEPLRVVFVGASRISFSGQGHSTRLERILGGRLNVVAICDPDAPRAEKVLAEKRAGPQASAYAGCKVYSSVQRLLSSASEPADIVIVAAPPMCRGSTAPGADVEVMLAQAWPGVAILVERPVSLEPVASVQAAVARLSETTSIVSVGYHLRALKGPSAQPTCR